MTHVVIVDDDEAMRYLVQQVVGTLGWTSDTAANGLEALEKMEGAVTDLVITDLVMPKMSGFDLLLSMKGDPRLARIPVVVMSALDRGPEASKAGCSLFVAKPFDVDALREQLPRLLG